MSDPALFQPPDGAGCGFFETPARLVRVSAIAVFFAPTTAPLCVTRAPFPRGLSTLGAGHYRRQAVAAFCRSSLVGGADPHPRPAARLPTHYTPPLNPPPALAGGGLGKSTFFLSLSKIFDSMNTTLKKGITQTPYFRRPNAVSNPPAQFDTLLQISEQDQINLSILKSIAEAGVDKFGVYSVGVDLMLSGGLRLSEILSPSAFFVTPFGQVAVNGRKGSASKLVSPIYQRAFWLQSQGWRANPFAFVSRWSWYRFFKSQGVAMCEKGRKNNIVTHSARKLQAHSLFNGGIELAGIRDIMGHRSENSTLYYSASRGV